ncbi:MAG: hypothetical protein LT103_15620, partial [Burkholderiaceae bacterium]|nr:hypothetical protein [Burkholderiaceae bacterium]
MLISQAAATSFIHIAVFAAIQTSHSMRKTGNDNGAHAAVDATGRSGASGGEIGNGDSGKRRRRGPAESTRIVAQQKATERVASGGAPERVA